MRRAFISGGTIALLALIFGASVAARPAPDTPRYDANSEYTMRGTVVETSTHPSVQGYEDMHLVLKTRGRTFEVHLGPVAFLSSRGTLPQNGEELEITGSLTPWQGAMVVLARQMVRFGKTIDLRDADGAPLWPPRLRS